MNYHKLISDAAVKLNSLVNEIIDTLDKEGTPVNPGTIISDLTAKAFPEKDNVTVVDPLDTSDPAGESILGELTPDNTENLYMSPEELSKRREEDRTRWAETDFKAGSPEHLAYIEKQNPGTLEKWASNKMKEAAEHLRGSNEHFGEEQAEGLDNLLAGLKDGPKDERW